MSEFHQSVVDTSRDGPAVKRSVMTVCKLDFFLRINTVENGNRVTKRIKKCPAV
jgi:hypothetical protein